jgi:tetratricopeptide (TPR) repeat protein
LTALLAGILALAGAMPHAWAQTAPLTAEESRAREDALELFNQGKLALKAQDYGRALDLFSKAQARFQKEPYIILALAKTLDKAGDLEKAKGYYELFLATAPTTQPAFAKDREATVQRLREIREELAKRPGVLKFKGMPSGAQLELNGKPADVDTKGELKVPAGTYSLRVTVDKRLPFERAAVLVGPGETKEIEVVMLAPVDPSTLPHDYTWTWVAGGASVAALLTGAVFGVLTQQSLDQYSKRFESDGNARQVTLDDYKLKNSDGSLQLKDGQAQKCFKGTTHCPDAVAEGNGYIKTFESRRTATIASLGTGAALGIVAVVLYLNAPLKDQPGKGATARTWHLLPSFDGHTASALIALDF